MSDRIRAAESGDAADGHREGGTSSSANRGTSSSANRGTSSSAGGSGPSRQLDGTGLKRLHRDWRRRAHGRLALVLDGLGTPTNVGSIVRSAAAYSVDQVWAAGPQVPDVNSAGVQKTALGTQRYVPWTTVATGTAAVAAARTAGYRIVALELADGAVALHQITAGLAADAAICLVVGHEDHGIAKATLAACDDVAFLPQLGKVGSLNVAVATAIALYEVRRSGW